MRPASLDPGFEWDPLNPSAAALETTRRATLVADFIRRRDLGELRPLVIPYSMFASFILPILYFSIPHTSPGRKWLFNARWLVFTVIVAMNLDLMRNTTSANFGMAYISGLLGAWGIIWGACLLIFTRPQFEFEVIWKRKKPLRYKGKKQHGRASGTANSSREEESGNQDTRALAKKANGVSREAASSQTEPDPEPDSDPEPELDLSHLDSDVRHSLSRGYEYYWQPYPSERCYLDRLRWSINLLVSFRGAGWSFAIPTIPRPARPANPGHHERVKMDTIPWKSYTGMTRCPTRRAFFAARFRTFATSYLLLDFLAVAMMKDPYFTTGDPSPTHPAVPYHLLALYRYTYVITGIWAALGLVFSIHETLQVLLGGYLFGPTGAEIWQYPSTYGSVRNITRRGLPGFWGGFWHQSFRFPFTAPGRYLFPPSASASASSSFLVRGTTLLLALGISGLLHAAGSRTTLPPTARPGRPLLFFLLSAAGMVTQTALSSLLRRRLAPAASPLWRPVVRRTANLLFAALWTYATAAPLADDFARSGIWLFEPVPFSPLRLLGFGHEGDTAWRYPWGKGQLPYLWAPRGGRWWEWGVAL